MKRQDECTPKCVRETDGTIWHEISHVQHTPDEKPGDPATLINIHGSPVHLVPKLTRRRV